MPKRAASPAKGGGFSLRDWTCPEVVFRPACPQAREAPDVYRAEGQGPAAGLIPSSGPLRASIFLPGRSSYQRKPAMIAIARRGGAIPSGRQSGAQIVPEPEAASAESQRRSLGAETD